MFQGELKHVLESFVQKVLILHMFKFYDTHVKPALKQPIEDLPNSSEIREKKNRKGGRRERSKRRREERKESQWAQI